MQQQPGQSTVRAFQSRNPATGEVVAEFPFISDDQVLKQIESSWTAFKTYSQTDLATRCQKLRKLADILEKDAEKYAKIMTKEMGKPIKAAIDEVLYCVQQSRYYADNAEEFLKPKVVTSGKVKNLVEYLPVGPIYVIVPFNFPFDLSFASSAPCLIVGNTVLYRTADSTPLTGKAIEELFVEAGFNNGEFQNIHSSPEQTELIISHKHIRGVSFTGSTRAGKSIASIAGKHAKKAVMELGGSDPFIVLDDADIQKAVDVAIDCRLFNCGQVCCAAKRFIIDDKIFDKFKEGLVDKTSKIKIGDPLKEETELGPLARADLRANIERQVTEAAKQGAKLLYGGKRPEDSELQGGNFYLPTVFEVDKKDNLLFTEETFGPVFALIRVKGEEEAVDLANDTEYGLAATIVSGNIERAQKVGRKIETGTVVLNGQINSDPAVPFGGVKGSGFGRQYSHYGVHEFANIKTTQIYQE